MYDYIMGWSICIKRKQESAHENFVPIPPLPTLAQNNS